MEAACPCAALPRMSSAGSLTVVGNSVQTWDVLFGYTHVQHSCFVFDPIKKLFVVQGQKWECVLEGGPDADKIEVSSCESAV